MDTIVSTILLSGTVAVAAAVAVVATVFALMTKAYMNRQKTGLERPPGPGGLGGLLAMYETLKTGRLAEVTARLAHTYGDILMLHCWPFPMNVVFLSNPHHVRQLYTDKSKRFVVSSRLDLPVTRILESNIVSASPGDLHWNKLRKLFHASLNFYGMKYERMETLIKKEVENVATTLQTSQGQDVEVRPLFFNSLLNLMHILLTGEQTEPGSEQQKALAACVEASVDVMDTSTILMSHFFPFLMYVPGSRVKRKHDDYVARHVNMQRFLYHNTKATHTPGRPRGLVDVWLDKVEDEDNDWLTDKHVQELINSLIGGGTMTTSETLTSMFLFLLNHPDVVSRIQTEVDRVMGPDAIPSLEQQGQCHYTQATVLETLRVVCVFPYSIPHLVTEDIQFKGYFIPKNTVITANQWKFQRSDALWENSLEFRPDRFLDENGELIPADHPLRLQMLPFGVGLRACPGASFARARLFLYLAGILKRFDLRPPKTGSLPPLTPSLDSWTMSTFMIVRGYSCQFAERTRK